jgi:hypothetical protein
MDRFKADTHRETYAHQLRIVTYELTEHFHPTIPELHHNDRIGKVSLPSWASNLRVIDAKRHDLSLPRILLPRGQGPETGTTEGTRRKTEDQTIGALLNEQTLTATSFPKYLGLLIRDRELLAYGVTFPHLHVRPLPSQCLILEVSSAKNGCRTGRKYAAETAHQSNGSPWHLTQPSCTTQLLYCCHNVGHTIEMGLG